MLTVIDALYEQNHVAIVFLSNAGEISLASDLDNKLKKHLVMAAASYYETQLRELIEGFAAAASNSNPAIVALIKNKALERQYHTYFDWKERNANQFFKYFGEPFNTLCRAEVRKSDDLTKAVSAFLELGEMRNKLAHLNFALYPIDKTSDEIYTLYQTAHRFVDFVKESLDKASKPQAPPAAPEVTPEQTGNGG
jgi:hypothetical protein